MNCNSHKAVIVGSNDLSQILTAVANPIAPTLNSVSKKRLKRIIRGHTWIQTRTGRDFASSGAKTFRNKQSSLLTPSAASTMLAGLGAFRFCGHIAPGSVASIIEVLFTIGACGAAHRRLPIGGAAYRMLKKHFYQHG